MEARKKKNNWRVDLSYYESHENDLRHFIEEVSTKGAKKAADQDPDETEREDTEEKDDEGVAKLHFIPPALFSKYKMKRDTGHGLEELWVTNQNLRILSKQIGLLLNLRTLSVANNRLSSIPEELGQLARLERLDLSGNKLATVPKTLASLTNLRELRIDRNELTQVPDSIPKLRRLSILSLSNNQISSIPGTLRRLRQLVELNLDSNALTQQAVDAVAWEDFSQSLQIIGLGGEQDLHEIPVTIFTLPALQLIRLPKRNFYPCMF